MITLFAGGAGFGLPEISPFCMKTEAQLQMAGLVYSKQRTNPTASPKGQMPFIDDDGELVADSHFIRLHIERKYRFDFDAHLSDLERGQAWAIERMLENHFYWAVVQARWLIPENFAKGPTMFFESIPAAFRDQARAEAISRVADRVLSSGLTRHTLSEQLDLATRTLCALSLQLDAKPYLFGNEPCGADATAFGMLASALTPFFDSALQRRVEEFDNLAAYVGRLMAQFYPAHAWAGPAIEGEFVVRESAAAHA